MKTILAIILLIIPAIAQYNLQLEGNENVLIRSDRKVSCIGGEFDEWDATFHSKQLLPSSCSVSAWAIGAQEPIEAVIFGLTSDPEASVYDEIEFGFLFDHTGYQIFQNGGQILWPSVGEFSASRGSIYGINYKNGKVDFFVNHVKVHTISTCKGRRFFLDGVLARVFNEILIYAKEI